MCLFVFTDLVINAVRKTETCTEENNVNVKKDSNVNKVVILNANSCELQECMQKNIIHRYNCFDKSIKSL